MQQHGLRRIDLSPIAGLVGAGTNAPRDENRESKRLVWAGASKESTRSSSRRSSRVTAAPHARPRGPWRLAKPTDPTRAPRHEPQQPVRPIRPCGARSPRTTRARTGPARGAQAHTHESPLTPRTLGPAVRSAKLVTRARASRSAEDPTEHGSPRIFVIFSFPPQKFENPKNAVPCGQFPRPAHAPDRQLYGRRVGSRLHPNSNLVRL